MSSAAAVRRPSPWIALLCGAVIVTIAMGLRQSYGLLLRPVELEIGVGREAFGLAIARVRPCVIYPPFYRHLP